MTIWECFSAKGVCKIIVIDGTVNALKYEEILQENLRVLNYLLITFSSRIIIQSIQLNLTRSSYLKIMLIFSNGQVRSRILI